MQKIKELLGPEVWDKLDRHQRRAFKYAYKNVKLVTQPKSARQLYDTVGKKLTVFQSKEPLYLSAEGFSHFAGEKFFNDDDTAFILFGKKINAFVVAHSGELYFMSSKRYAEDYVNLCIALYLELGYFSPEPFEAFAGLYCGPEGKAAEFIAEVKKQFLP